MKILIVSLCFITLSQITFSQVTSISIQGPDRLKPGSNSVYTCYANYSDGRTPTKIEDVVWTIDDYNPSYSKNGNYLEWQLGLLQVTGFVANEFDFYLKCKYQKFSKKLKVTVLPSNPKITFQNNSYVVWWVPDYVRDKTLAKEFSESVLEDAATTVLFEKILGITSKWITKLGGLMISFLTEIPSANPPSTINFKLIDKTKLVSIINVHTDDEILYQINYLGGVDLAWHQGMEMKLSKQKGTSEVYDSKMGFDFIKNLTLLTPLEGQGGLSIGKHIIYPKTSLKFSESGVYKLEITKGATSGNRVCYVQVKSKIEKFEEFVKHFFSDKKYQISRISFPIYGASYLEMNQGEFEKQQSFNWNMSSWNYKNYSIRMKNNENDEQIINILVTKFTGKNYSFCKIIREDKQTRLKFFIKLFDPNEHIDQIYQEEYIFKINQGEWQLNEYNEFY